MMQTREFEVLTLQERLDAIGESGVYLGLSRHQKPYKIALFDLDGMFVEVWLNTQTDKLTKAVSIITDRQLAPYLNQIDISTVFARI